MEQRTKSNGTSTPAKAKNGKLERRPAAAPRDAVRSTTTSPPRGRLPLIESAREEGEALDRRQLLTALSALRRGEFSVRLPIDYPGVDGKIADAFNDVVELNDRLAKELERLSRVVGKEGKIAQRASIGEVRGTWADTVTSVNALVGDLVHPTSETARVIGAVAKGDLSQTMALEVGGRPLEGEFLRTAKTVNTMVDQLGSFASEVTRVAREVGTEGKLGGQAEVKGVAGTWKDLTDSVNSMAGNLTSQVRNIAAVTTAVANGDLSKKITVDVKGEILELKNTINTMVDQLSSFAAEVTRVAREVGTEGKLGGQAEVKGVAGTWKDLTDSVNSMAGNLTSQVRNIATVTTAVAKGDLSKKITVDVRGEILELKDTINTMVDQLNSFASEVTRVAREVGTEGKLGGQAEVRGVAGTWKDLTDNVNFMAGNLTNQVRGIAKVVTAVANGDLKRKLAVDAKGEIAALADTINGMIETLATFADQVTTVAREVGTEGKLGGQASVPGAAGTWKDLTDNVNQLAANLTTQVRAIAEVATAVTKGDLTRSIKVEALGEVASLKDNINEMIRNLKDTTLKNSEQDWLKTNLAKFSRMLQGQKDLLTVGRLILSELAPVVGTKQGVFYIMEPTREEPVLKLLASYAYKERKNIDNTFKLGEGLVGQCALEREKILLVNVPKDYISITSGLGEAPPLNIIVMPVLFEGHVKAVLELASFDRFSPTHQAFLDQLTESIGIVLNTIEANMRTENLLKQSQSLAGELQSQQEELQQTNAELGEKARLLAEQNAEVERKNREVEQARQALEEKARQLALTSKYKSEFLANMSHELRTPLNSLLILSDQLSKNTDNNLTGRQVEFAKTIHSSGNDLLSLINDILDLSKIESGTVILDVGDLSFQDLSEYVERTFRHVADAKKLRFDLELGPTLPRSLHTDAKRLQQVLKNLLSNAFKFTDRGGVSLHVAPATHGWSLDNEHLNRATSVLAFTVRDTGIGIQPDKQLIIFEAFQQADGSTSRKYGGTGLGLAISREISRMLGGEIKLVSVPMGGSTFTLYLPDSYAVPRSIRRRESQLGEGSQPPAFGPASARPRTIEPTPPIEELVNPPSADTDPLAPDDHVLLIVDGDLDRARSIGVAARDHGFKGMMVARGGAAAAMARELGAVAIALDVDLPDIDGWQVLDRLKHDLTTRHIPVEVLAPTKDRARALGMGAFGLIPVPLHSRQALDESASRLQRFVAAPVRRLVLVDADTAELAAVRAILEGDDVTIEGVSTSAEGTAALTHQTPDLLVIGSDLPELSALDLLAHIDGDETLNGVPVLLRGDVAASDEARLARSGHGRTIKRVDSREALVDAVTIFLHLELAKRTPAARRILESLQQSGTVLAGKKVLVVDDDIRNIFAITTILDEHDMKTVSAETGSAAIDVLDRTPDIDIVLMDIMMPDMDGYDTMRAIRRRDAFRALPIIAVTAKAMKGDRAKCFDAGATDYVAKPVNPDQLLALLRVWLRS